MEHVPSDLPTMAHVCEHIQSAAGKLAALHVISHRGSYKEFGLSRTCYIGTRSHLSVLHALSTTAACSLNFYALHRSRHARPANVALFKRSEPPSRAHSLRILGRVACGCNTTQPCNFKAGHSASCLTTTQRQRKNLMPTALA